MPDFSGSKGRSDSWVAKGEPDAVLSALVDALQSAKGRVESRADGKVEMAIGSRSGYQMLGMMSPASMRPLRLRLVVVPESQAR